MKKYSLFLILSMFFAPCFGATLPTAAKAIPKVTIPKLKLMDMPTLEKVLAQIKADSKEAKPNQTFGLKRSPTIGMATSYGATTVETNYHDENEGFTDQPELYLAAPSAYNASTGILVDRKSPAITAASTSNISSSSASDTNRSGLNTPSPSIITLSALDTPSSSVINLASLINTPSLTSPTPISTRAGSTSESKSEIPEGSFLYTLLQRIEKLPCQRNATEDAQYKWTDFMKDDFITTTTLFFKTMKKCMDDKKLWVGQKPATIFCTKRSDTQQSTFTPFVQKITIPDQEHVRHIGDIHGDVHYLVDTLVDMFHLNQISADLKLAHGMYMLFHGDLVDRGIYGIETLWVTMLLKIANPNQVFMLRGNHEYWAFNADIKSGGLARELCKLDANSTQEELNARFQKMFEALYNLLPIALIINNNILCCHGAPDWCYNPTALQAAAMPVAFECLTKENYNPAWITSKLSDQTLHNMACDISECIEKSPETLQPEIAENLSETLKNFTQGYTNIADHMEKAVNAAMDKANKTILTMQQNGVKAATDTLQQAINTYASARDKLQDAIDSSAALIEEINKFAKETSAIMDPMPLLTFYKRIVATTQELEKNATITAPLALDIAKPSPNRRIVMLDAIKKYARDVEATLDSTTKGPLLGRLTEIARLQQTLVDIMRNPGQAVRSKIFAANHVNPADYPILFDPTSGVFTILFTSLVDAKPWQLGEHTLAFEDFMFLWGDLIIDPNRVFICELTPDAGKRFNQERMAMGKDLVREIMKLQNFHCVIRGHQQFSSMRKPLDDNKGIAPLWNSRANFANGQEYPLEEGCVYTLDVAKAPFPQLNARTYNSSAVITYGSTFATCTIYNELDIFSDEDQTPAPTPGLAPVPEVDEIIVHIVEPSIPTTQTNPTSTLTTTTATS